MAKRIFDFIFSLFGLLFFLPVLLIIAVLIKIFMPGPIIFKQERVGQYGQIFTLYKFRTMIEDHGGGTISIKGDSRITPFGTKLRKHKLDELPELWNVLKGDMSLVGPRPDVPEYIGKLNADEKHFLNLRPGITSPASLKYANEEVIVASATDPLKFYNDVIWPDKVGLNLEYYRNRSFFGDLVLLFRTMFGIFFIDEKRMKDLKAIMDEL